MQKTSRVNFDPFADDRSILDFFSKAWRKTTRMWHKGTLMDEMEYDLKRLEASFGMNILAKRQAELIRKNNLRR